MHLGKFGKAGAKTMATFPKEMHPQGVELFLAVTSLS